MTKLEREIAAVLNRHNLDTVTNTPDYVLAKFVVRCLDAYRFAAGDTDVFFWTGTRGTTDRRCGTGEVEITRRVHARMNLVYAFLGGVVIGWCLRMVSWRSFRRSETTIALTEERQAMLIDTQRRQRG